MSESRTRSSRPSSSALRTSAILLAAALGASACRSAGNRPAVPAGPPKVPHLTLTKFLAFGDSLTQGGLQSCPGAGEGGAPSSASPGLLLAQGRGQPTPISYPTRLQAMLTERYAAQSIAVINEGLSGEDIERGATDLPRVLTVDMPEVLLLQEGVNTVNAHRADGIPLVVEGLRGMIREARRRGITVLAATLLPERAGGCRAYDYAQGHEDIIAANVRIRGMIGAEGGVLVDLYEAFNGRTSLLIGQDGLHPSAAGYQQMADAFFEAITSHLED
jgi:lysophospholipase L1-like esterase